MKRFAGIVLLLLCMSLLGCAVAVAALPKRIFITLDVSSSMKGNKYVMANYAAQALTVFSNADDVVTVYYLGRRHELRGADGYRQLQIPYGRHRGTSSYFEISDITEFLKDYVDSHLDRGDRVPVFLGPQLSEEFHEPGTDGFIEAINIIRAGGIYYPPGRKVFGYVKSFDGDSYDVEVIDESLVIDGGVIRASTIAQPSVDGRTTAEVDENNGTWTVFAVTGLFYIPSDG